MIAVNCVKCCVVGLVESRDSRGIADRALCVVAMTTQNKGARERNISTCFATNTVARLIRIVVQLYRRLQ